MHQATVELYLEDIILGVVEHTAGQQAREEVQRMAREVNDVAYALEERYLSLVPDQRSVAGLGPSGLSLVWDPVVCRW